MSQTTSGQGDAPANPASNPGSDRESPAFPGGLPDSPPAVENPYRPDQNAMPGHNSPTHNPPAGVDPGVEPDLEGTGRDRR